MATHLLAVEEHRARHLREPETILQLHKNVPRREFKIHQEFIRK